MAFDAHSVEPWYEAATDEWVTIHPNEGWRYERVSRPSRYDEEDERAVRDTLNWPILLLAPAQPHWRVTLENTLRGLYHEASQPDWDGYGGHPVSAAAYQRALAFAHTLPDDAPAPDVSAHPDGEIAFEWLRSAGDLLTVAVSEDGELNYAAIFDGRNKVHGSEHFANETPEAIRHALARLFRTT